MPGELPAASAYTWAAEFAVDEGEEVVFSEPVYAYVEDFLGFGAGAVGSPR
jgi:hypothetical protein